MAKNRKFKKIYTVTAKGITTNGYAEDFIDMALSQMVKALDMQYKQVSVTMKEGKYGIPNRMAKEEKEKA